MFPLLITIPIINMVSSGDCCVKIIIVISIVVIEEGERERRRRRRRRRPPHEIIIIKALREVYNINHLSVKHQAADHHPVHITRPT